MIHSKRSHVNQGRKLFIAGKITKEEFIQVMKLEVIVDKKTIHSMEYGVEKLYPNRASEVEENLKVSKLLGH